MNNTIGCRLQVRSNTCVRTSHDSALDNPTAMIPPMNPNSAYSTANVLAIRPRVAPTALRIIDSYSRRYLVAANAAAMTRPPVMTQNSATARIARASRSKTLAKLRSTSPTWMALTFGKAATTACCNDTSCSGST